jgi:ABC-type xylose transport system permease subunit
MVEIDVRWILVSSITYQRTNKQFGRNSYSVGDAAEALERLQ